NDATVLANGWELDITLAYDGIIPVDNFFPLVEALGNVSKTRVRLQEEILAGCWESLATDRADLLICPRLETMPHDVKVESLGRMSFVWVAASGHYVHKRSGAFDESARQKYRIIAIADTAREQPPISVNILQKQPRLTVTNFAAKCQALTNGLGIGTLPKSVADPLIEAGKLQMIHGTETQEAELVLAWRRNKMGEAKSWCIQYLKSHWNQNMM
ncbi:LysR substrate-binding domain-containing protein, partial [Vibrio mangrovi]